MTEQLLNIFPAEIANLIDDHLVESHRKENAKKCSDILKKVERKENGRSAVITADDNVTMYGTCPYCNGVLSIKQIKTPELAVVHNHWAPVCEDAAWERGHGYFSKPTVYQHMTSWTLDFAAMKKEEEEY